MFSLPMLYTMEVWWSGFLMSSLRILLLLGFTVLILLAYNTFAGVRSDETFWGVVIDSVEELGIGLLISTAVLSTLGRIEFGDAPREILGKIVVEAMLVAIGVSIGTAQLGDNDDESGGIEGEDGEPQSILSRLSMAACGAVIVVSNIAPTEEIVVLGLECDSRHFLVMVFVSLVLASTALSFSQLMGRSGDGPRWFRYGLGTCMTYAVTLMISALILWLFGRFDGRDFQECLDLTVVLALPGSIGASMGSLLLK